MTREELIVATLERENADLRDRVAFLEACLFDHGARCDLLGLTASEARVFGALMKRPMLSKEQLLAILYEDRAGGDTPDPKIVDVFVCKIRAKIKDYDILIQTVRGRGYTLTPQMKDAVRVFLAAFGEEGTRAA